MKTKKVQKLMTFSQDLFNIISFNAKAVGLSFNEYVRHLLAQDIEVKKQNADIPYVDEQTEKEIGEAYADYKAGRYTAINNKKELEDFFNSL